MVGAARLECGEPAAEASELIRRQLGDSFGDLFDFHAAQYSTAEAWLSGGWELVGLPLHGTRLCRRFLNFAHVSVVYSGHLPIVPSDCDRIPTRVGDNATISGIAPPINAGNYGRLGLKLMTLPQWEAVSKGERL